MTLLYFLVLVIVNYVVLVHYIISVIRPYCQ